MVIIFHVDLLPIESHLIIMIDHFKLNIGATDAYMSIQQPILCKLWEENS